MSLGLGMLGVVVAAGLSPNAGVVRAASNCTYGQCVSSQPFPLWAVASSVAAVVVALLLALLLLRRRRRPGQPPSEWQGPGGAGGAPPGATGTSELPEEAGTMGAGAAAVSGAGPSVEPVPEEPPAWHEGAPSPTGEEPEAVAAPTAGAAAPPVEYIEPQGAHEPEPTAAPPPEPAPLTPSISGPPAGAAPTTPPPPAAAGEAEPDIDSLMAELEKISGEILKQKPKKKNGTATPKASHDNSS